MRVGQRPDSSGRQRPQGRAGGVGSGQLGELAVLMLGEGFQAQLLLVPRGLSPLCPPPPRPFPKGRSGDLGLLAEGQPPDTPRMPQMPVVLLFVDGPWAGRGSPGSESL